MANIKSQIKRNRQNDAARIRNKSTATTLKTSGKKFRSAVTDGDEPASQELLRAASRQIDKAVSKGALHKRSAARRKSRLARAAASSSN